MSDFLTRLVAATYTPAVSVRPRPVAHYEPMAAPLPIWAPSVEPSPAAAHDEIAAQAPATVKSLDAQGAPAEHSNLSVEKAGEQLRAPAVAPPRQTVALHQDATTGRGASLATRAEAGRGTQRTAAGYESIAARSQETAGDRRLAGAQAPQPLQALRPPIGVAASTRVAPAPAAPPLASARRELEPVRPSAAVATLPAAATTLEPNRLHETHETVVGATPPVSLAAQRQTTALAPAISSDERALPGDRHGHAQPALPSAHQLLAVQHIESAAPMRDAVSTMPPAPVVRVTIGRIVVKAESAASPKDAPMRPAQPSRPALSLDQYLKARSGGDA